MKISEEITIIPDFTWRSSRNLESVALKAGRSSPMKDVVEEATYSIKSTEENRRLERTIKREEELGHAGRSPTRS